MKIKGQSSIEWLMTHAWSIIVVLSVSAVLFYAGVFEATGRPRFEGLAAASLQPMPEQVQLYSDGILVLAIANTKPYGYTYDWVEVAPIADKDNTIRTTLGAQIPRGGIGVYYVNGSNLGGVSGATMIILPNALAGEDTVDFYYRHKETWTAAGTSGTYTTPWATAHQIPRNPENSPTSPPPGTPGGGGGPTGCQVHRACECTEPPGLNCQGCWEGSDFIMKWDNYGGCTYIPGGGYVCWPTDEVPEGICIADGTIPCTSTPECPLSCQACIGGYCQSDCTFGGNCQWSETFPMGDCV